MCLYNLDKRYFFLLFHMASGQKQADARYDYCPCTPCRTHDPPFVQQRRTIHRHRQREEMNMRDKALVTARSGKTSLRRALKKPDDPGIPNAVKSFRVGRTGYVITDEASTGLGGPLHLGRAPKKPDDSGIPNAGKGFRVGRTGYVIAGEASTGLGKLFPLPLPQNLSTFAQKANLPHLNSTYA